METVVMLAWLNGWEVVAILAVVLVLFGAKKLPELARGLGQGIKEFKKSSREIQDEIQTAIDMDEPPPKRSIPSESQARIDSQERLPDPTNSPSTGRESSPPNA